MDISYIAMHRMTEMQMKKDPTFREMVEKKGEKKFLYNGREMSDDGLLDKLKSLGLQMDRQTLDELKEDFLSAEEMSRWLIDKNDIVARGMEIDWVWISLTVLWERWFPEKPSMEMLDDIMQKGYEKSETRDPVGACELWLKVWRLLLDLAEEKHTATLGELDRIFRGTQSIFNWVQDLETELWNSGTKSNDFIAARISFCEEFLKRFRREDSLLFGNMKRALATSYYENGEREKTDALFQQWLKEDPRWGWGWIGWADCYWMIERKEKDYDKAISILKEGFAVPGVSETEYMKERLEGIFHESGREGDIEAFLLSSGYRRANIVKNDGLAGDKLTYVKSVKVGRNEPCSCGSGKKYKKCCGSNYA